MTDVGVADTGLPDAAVVANIVDVPITKVKGESVSVNFDELPIEVYKEMLFLGAKEYINKVGMSKIGAGMTKMDAADLEKAQKAVVAQAQKNVTDMNSGKIKYHGEAKSATKVSGAVQAEAMRLAKNLVKDAMKKAGLKISHTPASEITAAAKVVLSNMPELIATATANLEARAATPMAGIDITKLVKADPELVKKADAAKAAKKKPGGQLSAKQAGIPVKSKPKAGASPTAH